MVVEEGGSGARPKFTRGPARSTWHFMSFGWIITDGMDCLISIHTSPPKISRQAGVQPKSARILNPRSGLARHGKINLSTLCRPGIEGEEKATIFPV